MEKIFLLSGLAIMTAFNFISNENNVKENHAAKAIITDKAAVATPTKIEETPGTTTAVAANSRKLVKPVLHLIPKQEDTTKKKKPVSYSDLSFPSVSTTANDDGKSRQETINVTDQHGKKYTISRQNDKITSMVIDGKQIPEAEYGNHAELIKKIDRVRHESQIRARQATEERKIASERRQNMNIERQRVERENNKMHMEDQARLTREKNEELRRVQEKYRKEQANDRRKMEVNQRRQQEEMNKIRENYRIKQERARENQQEYMRQQREYHKKQELLLQKQRNTTKTNNKYGIEMGNSLNALSLKSADYVKEAVGSKPVLLRSKPVQQNNATLKLSRPVKLKSSQGIYKAEPVRLALKSNRQFT